MNTIHCSLLINMSQVMKQEDCMSNKKQFPYLTDPTIFYKLLESADRHLLKEN